MNESLRRKLDELAALEKKYNVVGVGIMSDPNQPAPTTEEAIDYVLDFVKQAVETVEAAHGRVPYTPEFQEAMDGLEKHQREKDEAGTI